jgi:hypothetical protein
MGARGNRFTGPGYSILGAWYDEPLDADIVIVVARHASNTVGTHCVAGNHRWLSGGITSVRTSQQMGT